MPSFKDTFGVGFVLCATFFNRSICDATIFLTISSKLTVGSQPNCLRAFIGLGFLNSRRNIHAFSHIAEQHLYSPSHLSNYSWCWQCRQRVNAACLMASVAHWFRL